MNLLTHFRKITILRFVLVGSVLLFSVPALFADGIASRYPNDVGIENDFDVILADGFETYTSAGELLTKWDVAQGWKPGRLRIATEPGNYVGGHQGLEMKLPISTTEISDAVIKKFSPELTTVYVRTYEKFDLGFDAISGHNGIRVNGHYPFNPCTGTPRDGTGWFHFIMQNGKLGRGGENLPGFAHVYSYWPYQRSDCGDHWYSDGYVIPGGWGPWVLYPNQYPDFKAIPNWQPLRGVWYCYEFMVKLNDLGKRNGEVAYWIDGQLKARFTNLFLRSVDSLKINDTGLLLHALHSDRINKKWYDNVVIARSYIGPISPPKPISRAIVADFNSDGSPDYVLQNTSTRQTAIWYLNNNVFVSAAYGPTLPVGWNVIDVVDFNLDGNLDYALFNASTRQTAIWYLSGVAFVSGAYGPTLPSGWTLLATDDFNGDGKPDYMLYNGSTRRTAVWYMNDNVFTGGAYGPTLPAGWSVIDVADFNLDGNLDYALFNASTRQTAIWHLSGVAFVSGAYGPTLPSGWTLLATDDFNGDGKPDYVLFNPSTRRTAIWYLNNNIFISGAYGPTLP
jgi:FG-GAP-like repeat